MKKVLITGAFGFLGRHTARFFDEQGWWVTGIGHGQWSETEWRQWGLAQWHCADLTADTMATYAGLPDAIVHCAGSADVAFSMRHPRQDFERSVTTTLDILEFAREHAPAVTVVYPSSAAVYGQVTALPILEQHPRNPVSPYGLHKLMGEQLVQSYTRHYQVPAAIVRFFSVYGAGLKKQILWDACNRLSRGEYGFFGSGQETRDFLHVKDAAALMGRAVAHAGPDCPVVNGGAGRQIAIKEIVAEIAAALETSQPPVFTGDARKGDPDHYLADIARARAWEWQPEYPLQTGLNDYVQWF